MTETERKLCTNYKEIRQADICLLAISSYYIKYGDKGEAHKIDKFRQKYLKPFMAIIKEEKAQENNN